MRAPPCGWVVFDPEFAAKELCLTEPNRHSNARGHGRLPRRRGFVELLSLALLAAVSVGFATAGTAAAVKPASNFSIGFADSLYNDPAESDHEMALTETTNADVIRVNMYWSLVAFNKPADPRDPDDPNYDWSGYDTAIANAADHGFEVDLTVLAAPSWAEGPNRPADTEKYPHGSWRPDAAAFGDFAHAVAVRYSGDYTTPAGVRLPQVEYFEAWNEPNLSTYITPQWDGKQNVASDIYAKLLDAFYAEVKAVNPDSEVVSGGTAPYGDDPPKGNQLPNRTRPLRFEQELLCLSPKNKRSKCPNGASSSPSFDIYAHHPINRLDPPEAKALNNGDIEVADFGSLTKVMRKAEKLGTTATPGRHDMWANEVWWQTNPPDKAEGFPLKTQARYMSEALYMLWDEGASNVSFLQFRDAKYTPGEFTLASYQTGVYTYNGKRKPSADAVAFPFVTDRKSSKKLLAWGRAPASGRLTIEAKGKDKTKGKHRGHKRRRGGGYRKVASFKVRNGEIFTKNLKIKGKAKLRAKVGGEKSLVWNQKD